MAISALNVLVQDVTPSTTEYLFLQATSATTSRLCDGKHPPAPTYPSTHIKIQLGFMVSTMSALPLLVH